MDDLEIVEGLCEKIRLTKMEVEDYKGMALEFKAVITETIRDIKKSIPMASNEYVRTGYEISLDIIKSSLARNNLNTKWVEDIGSEEE